MQLDFANFMSFLELISNHKFAQHRSYVDIFIKSYYFSPEQLEEWIEKQSKEDEYSSKQLTSLIQCICISDKRTRQRLLQVLESVGGNDIPNKSPQKDHSFSGSNLSNVI